MSDDLKKGADEIIKIMDTKLNASKGVNKDWGKQIDIIFTDYKWNNFCLLF